MTNVDSLKITLIGIIDSGNIFHAEFDGDVRFFLSIRVI